MLILKKILIVCLLTPSFLILNKKPKIVIKENNISITKNKEENNKKQIVINNPVPKTQQVLYDQKISLWFNQNQQNQDCIQQNIKNVSCVNIEKLQNLEKDLDEEEEITSLLEKNTKDAHLVYLNRELISSEKLKNFIWNHTQFNFDFWSINIPILVNNFIAFKKILDENMVKIWKSLTDKNFTFSWLKKTFENVFAKKGWVIKEIVKKNKFIVNNKTIYINKNMINKKINIDGFWLNKTLDLIKNNNLNNLDYFNHIYYLSKKKLYRFLLEKTSFQDLAIKFGSAHFISVGKNHYWKYKKTLWKYIDFIYEKLQHKTKVSSYDLFKILQKIAEKERWVVIEGGEV